MQKDRYDSKSGQIVYHVCYSVLYYMDPDTAKFSRLKWFKFVSRLILMWEIQKCNSSNLKLPLFAIAISFTANIIYVLYGPQKGKLTDWSDLSFFLD